MTNCLIQSRPVVFFCLSQRSKELTFLFLFFQCESRLNTMTNPLFFYFFFRFHLFLHSGTWQGCVYSSNADVIVLMVRCPAITSSLSSVILLLLFLTPRCCHSSAFPSLSINGKLFDLSTDSFFFFSFISVTLRRRRLLSQFFLPPWRFQAEHSSARLPAQKDSVLSLPPGVSGGFFFSESDS